VYTALGLASEAGEVAGKVKKAIRDEGGVISPERRDALAHEIGDVLWYCARLAAEIGYDLNDIGTMNLSKLNARKTQGLLGGDGDTRGQAPVSSTGDPVAPWESR
jgi:NTP pyrophosphatase (non-canonical NTP hydrolase)